MKIHQLPQGARFEYEGEEYVKTGPMLGTGNGRQRLIPRYAVLKPLDKVEIPREIKQAALPRADVLKAIEAFYTECAMLVPKDKLTALQAAHDRLLKAFE